MSWQQMHEAVSLRMRAIRLADLVGICVLLAIAAFLAGRQRQSFAEVSRSLDAIGARTYKNQANRIYHIAINDKRIVDQTLANVARMSTLEQLSLSRSTLGSGQTKHLASMNSLRSLTLYDTNLSSYELGYVSQCRNLEVLSLDGTPIGNAGIRSLTNLDALRYLSLARTEIDNSAIDSLAILKGLEELDLRGTNVTPRAVAQLREALPACRITTDSPKPTMRDSIAVRRRGRRHRFSM